MSRISAGSGPDRPTSKSTGAVGASALTRCHPDTHPTQRVGSDPSYSRKLTCFDRPIHKRKRSLGAADIEEYSAQLMTGPRPDDFVVEPWASTQYKLRKRAMFGSSAPSSPWQKWGFLS